MDFNNYQEKAIGTAICPDLYYLGLGLGGEAGECLNKLKKIIRDQNGVVTESNKTDLKSELGDVLWYLSALANMLNISLDDIATYNLDKLQKRKLAGTIGGSGDHR